MPQPRFQVGDHVRWTLMIGDKGFEGIVIQVLPDKDANSASDRYVVEEVSGRGCGIFSGSKLEAAGSKPSQSQSDSTA